MREACFEMKMKYISITRNAYKAYDFENMLVAEIFLMSALTI